MNITLDREHLERFRSKLHDQGVALTGDSGETEYNGTKIDYAYDESQQLLKLDIKANLIVRKVGEGKIRQWIQENA